MVDLRIVSEESNAPEDDATGDIIRKLVTIVEAAFKDGLSQGRVAMMHTQNHRIIAPDCPWDTPYATAMVLMAFKPEEDVAS